jgi:predicted negative regulator of RcsB-dependent stress response
VLEVSAEKKAEAVAAKNRGDALQRTGDLAGALQAYSDAVTADPAQVTRISAWVPSNEERDVELVRRRGDEMN